MSRLWTLILGLLIISSLMATAAAQAAPVSVDYAEAERSMRAGVEKLRQENYEEAIEDFEAVRKALPGSSMAAYYLGVAYKKTQDFERAKKNLKDAVELEPAVREAVVELADVYFQTGDIENAIAMIGIAEKEQIRPAETAFLKGLVLIKLKRYTEAVGSFENAASLDAGLQGAAEYHIGVAKMLEGSFKEASEVFRSTIQRDPTTDLAAFAAEYLDAITRRLRVEDPLRFTAWAGILYDDNVLLKPGDETVAGSVTDEADFGYNVSLKADYRRPLRGRYSLEAQYSFYLLDFVELSSHDVMTHAVMVSPGYVAGGGIAALPLSVEYTMVDGFGYLTTARVRPTYTFSLGADTMVRLLAGVETNGFRDEPIDPNEDRDNVEIGFGAEWYRVLAGDDATAATERRGFATARYEFTTSDSDGPNWRHQTHTVGAGAAYPAGARLTAAVSAEAAIQNFTETHTVFGKKRRDRTYTLGSMLSYSLTEYVDAVARLTYVRGNSNIALYDYDKFVVSAGAQFRF